MIQHNSAVSFSQLQIYLQEMYFHSVNKNYIQTTVNVLNGVSGFLEKHFS